MNGFYITNLDTKYQGGLFHATYERIKRHSSNMDQITVINNNFYLRKEEQYTYKELNIINMNYKRSISYIFDKFLTNRQEKQLVATYRSKFNNLLEKADFIHAHWGWPNGYIAYKLAKEYSIPYFITFHGSDINNLKERNKKNMLKAMESASKCFFVSNALLDAAINKGYSGNNSDINYNGVDLSEFHLKSSKSKTIAYVGTLIEKKGADLLPIIFKCMSDIEKELSFKIIGDGLLKGKIHKEIQQLGLENKVEFIGAISKENVASMMREFDLVIIPSRMEGLGMVILEANACGVPVVGSNRGGITEAIGDKKNYFALNQNFPMQISKRAINILNDKNYEENSIKLRERIKGRFTWERTVERELKTYKEVVNSIAIKG